MPYRTTRHKKHQRYKSRNGTEIVHPIIFKLARASKSPAFLRSALTVRFSVLNGGFSAAQFVSQVKNSGWLSRSGVWGRVNVGVDVARSFGGRFWRPAIKPSPEFDGRDVGIRVIWFGPVWSARYETGTGRTTLRPRLGRERRQKVSVVSDLRRRHGSEVGRRVWS